MEHNTAWNRNGNGHGAEIQNKMDRHRNSKWNRHSNTKIELKCNTTWNRHENTTWNRNVIQNGTDGIQNRTENGNTQMTRKWTYKN